jgi:hypothetical protein
MNEIKVIVGKDGSLKIDVHGVKGVSCKDLTQELEKNLGVVTEDDVTQEYYQDKETLVNQQGIGQRQ